MRVKYRKKALDKEKAVRYRTKWLDTGISGYG
jgi:hypothetical protein